MEPIHIALVGGVVVAYALVSRPLANSPLTAPMFFVGVGMLVGPAAFNWLDLPVDHGVLRLLAQATLVMVLFTDAVKVDPRSLGPAMKVPLRLLSLGMPLSILAGTIAGLLFVSDLNLAEAALLAAILAPTDVALGEGVFRNPKVPKRVREMINVEAGLNSGLALPMVTILLAVAAADDLGGVGQWVEFAIKQVGFGVALGAAIGYVGGWVLDRFAALGWVDRAFLQLATVAIAAAAYGGAEAASGSGFVAAYVAGLTFSAAAKGHCHHAEEFAEGQGRLLSLLTFFFFGAAIAGPALELLDWRIALYVVLSLTVVRMLPVALVLRDTGLQRQTIRLIGWLGPRGLAAMLFGLLILEEANLTASGQIFLVTTWTVLVSVFVHGVSAVWIAGRYGGWHARSVTEGMTEWQAPPEEEDTI